MNYQEIDVARAQVVYQLNRNGELEDPHLIEVQYPSKQDGLRLKDVKHRLSTLRGKGLIELFSWSYKRNYKSTFIWSDVIDDDVILPLPGSGEYVIRASELIDIFATATDRVHHKCQSELNQKSSSPSQETPDSKYHLRTPKNNHGAQKVCHNMPVLPNGGETLSTLANMSETSSEDEKSVGALITMKENPPTISLEQETIDLERSDFCFSSSDSEISPRQDTALVKDVRTPLVLSTRSSTSTAQGSESSNSSSSFTSPESPLGSPSARRRIWKKDIRRSLFRTESHSVKSISGERENNIMDGAVNDPSRISIGLFSSDVKSENLSADAVDAPTVQTEKKPDQTFKPHLNVVQMLWARWTGGCSKHKKKTATACEQQFSGDTNKDVKREVPPASAFSRSASQAVGNGRKPSLRRSFSSACRTIFEGNTTCNIGGRQSEFLEELLDHHSEQKAANTVGEPVTPRANDVCPANVSCDLTDSSLQPGVEQLKTPSTPALEEMPQTPLCQTQPMTPPFESFASPAIARIHVRSIEHTPNPARETGSAGKPLPPGFHKGTNDTKPRSARRHTRSPSTASSPTLTGSISRNGVGSSSGRRTIFHELSELNRIGVDTIVTDFRAMDERPITPGLSTLDWEKSLHEAVKNSTPPPDFKRILKECSTCGRKFRPDSLKVHLRGCHSLRRIQVFSTPSSHMLQT